ARGDPQLPRRPPPAGSQAPPQGAREITMKLIGAGRTDVGRRRDFNEDSLAIDLDAGLLALADGMGGHAAGEVASRIATETVLEFVRQTAGKTEIDWPFGYDERLSK